MVKAPGVSAGRSAGRRFTTQVAAPSRLGPQMVVDSMSGEPAARSTSASANRMRASGAGVSSGPQVEAERDQVRGAEAEVQGGERVEAPDHEAGADQEHDGQTDLGGDEETARSPAARGPATPGHGLGVQAFGARGQGGNEAEDQCGGQGEERADGKDGTVHHDVHEGGDVLL